MFAQLRRFLPLAPAVVISSAAFVAHHVVVLATYFGWFSVLTLFFSFSIGVGGAVWAWLYDRTGSLQGPWLSHVFADLGIFVVGYDLASRLFS